MKVTISYEHGLNLVVGTAVSHAVSSRISVTLKFGCATINVPDFPTFLRCMWAGYSYCSSRSLGEQMRRIYTISICMDDGTMYGVWVRYDEDSKGIRYGSIQ